MLRPHQKTGIARVWFLKARAMPIVRWCRLRSVIVVMETWRENRLMKSGTPLRETPKMVGWLAAGLSRHCHRAVVLRLLTLMVGLKGITCSMHFNGRGILARVICGARRVWWRAVYCRLPQTRWLFLPIHQPW